ncbi:MAG: MFS transporter [Alphaproteobacteria bacterium]|nr:MAG: MFS transporter [Alphaproteobacteria bacterium]
MKKQTITKAENLSWFMWLCGGIFYAYQFVLRVSPTVMVQEIRADLSLQNCDLGILISYYYNGYAWLQIPAGFILDYMGPRRPIIWATGLCSVGCVLFGLGETLFTMGIGRFMIGVGSAFAFLSALKIANLWFPKRLLPLMVSLTLLMGSLGATVAGIPLTLLIESYGWRITLVIFGAIGFMLMGISACVVRDHPLHLQIENRLEWSRIWADFLFLIRSIQTWIFGMFGFCMYVPLSGFGDLWGTSYVMAAYDISKMQASGHMTAFYLGIGLSGPAIAAMSDHLKTHSRVMRWTALLGFISFVYLLYGPKVPLWMLGPYLFIAGGCVAGQFLAFTSVSVLNPTNLSGRATGVYNMFSMVSGVVAQPFIGSILDICSPGEGEASLIAFQYGLSVMPVVLFVSFILTFWMKESYSYKGVEFAAS